MSLRVLITGASSGLGREMAVQMGRRGARVALTGRRESKLKAACEAVREAGGEPLLLCGDVTDAAQVKRHYARVQEAWGGLDWAVLNAGVGESDSALFFKAETIRWTFKTNVFGAANWMEAVLPDMLAQNSGVIAGISSIAGWRGLPGSGAYCASKAAFTTLLESVRVDLIGTGVDVVTVCPGFVRSEMTDRNAPAQMPFLLETPDGAARILRGIEARRRIVHFPWQLSLTMKHLVHNMPGFLYDFIASKLGPRTKKKYVDESKPASKR